MSPPRPTPVYRVGKRQVAVWLPEPQWAELDRLAERRGWCRGVSLALLLEQLGRSSLAEAVVAEVSGRRRQGWARPFLRPEAPACRRGMVRLAVWLSAPLAREVSEALRMARQAGVKIRVVGLPETAAFD